MSARDLLNSVHSSESLVKWIWSGLARGGSPFPASVSIKLHLSSKHLKPGDAQWVTLFSANLECGHTVLSGEGKLNVPSAVHTDGWARMLLHAVNKEEEVYAFCDLPSIMLVADPKGTVPHTLVVGEDSNVATLRVTVKTSQVEPSPPRSPKSPPASAKPTTPKPLAAASAPAGASPPALPPAAAAAAAAVPGPAHSAAASPPTLAGATLPSGDPKTPHSHSSALAQHLHIRETTTAAARLGDIDGLLASSPPKDAASSGSSSSRNSPPPSPAALAQALARAEAAEAAAQASAAEALTLKEDLVRSRARCSTLEAQLKSAESSLAASAAAAQHQQQQHHHHQQQRQAAAAGAPPSAPSYSSVVADAVGKAARETKLRQSAEARRAAAEEALAAMKEDMRAFESERMELSARLEEAQRALVLVESYGLRTQKAEAALEAMRAAQAHGSRAAASASASASAAVLAPDLLAALRDLCHVMQGVVEGTARACAEAARTAPTLSDIAASFSLPEEEGEGGEEAPHPPSITPPPSTPRSPQAVGGGGLGGGPGGGRGARGGGGGGGGGGSAGGGSSSLPSSTEVGRLCKRGRQAAGVILELVRSLGACLEVNVGEREAVERERESIRSEGLATIEERSNLVRDWQKYAEHWEGRGREAEKLLGEWSKAYASLEKQKNELLEALQMQAGGGGGGGSGGRAAAIGGAAAAGGEGGASASSGRGGNAAPPPPVLFDRVYST